MRRWTIVACALVAVLAWAGIAQAGAKRQVSLNFYRATVSQAKYHKMLAKDVDVAAATTRGKKVTLQICADEGPGSRPPRPGRDRHGHPQLEGPDRPPGGSRADVQRLQRLARLRRPGRAARMDVQTREGKPAAGQARGHRPHRRGPRDHRAEADPGREGRAGRQPPGGSLQRDPARPRVDRARGRPAAAALLHRRVAGERQGRSRTCSRHASCGSSSSPTRTATSTRSDPERACGGRTCATTTATARSPRSATASTRTATIPEHWNYDDEGSVGDPSSDTYRGPSAGSEPETQAIEGLFDRIDFKFQVNYHSFGPCLLYPQGWQIGTPTADDPIYYALAGNRDNPAIPGFVPGLCVRRPLRDERRDDRLRVQPRRHDLLHARARARAAPAAGSSSRTTRRSCRPSSRRRCRSTSTWPKSAARPGAPGLAPRASRRSRST